MKTISQVFKYIKDTQDRDVDAMVIMTIEDMKSPSSFYLSKFESTFSKIYLFKKDNEGFFLTDLRYYERAKKEINIEGIKVLPRTKESIEMIRAKVRAGKTLAFERDYVTYTHFGIYKEIYKNDDLELVPVEIDGLRLIKDEFEIESIKKAVQLTDLVFEKLIRFIKPGMTEVEIARQVSIEHLKAGAQKDSFDAIVAAGENGANPHHISGNYKVKDGDLITIDIGCYVNGYASDITRTFVLGDLKSAKLLEIYELVRNAHEEAKAFYKAGLNAGQAHENVVKILDKSKYGEYFTHALGHGIGLQVHEGPDFAPGTENDFKNGMIASNEPGLYVPGVGGVRIEDLMLINGDKPISLSKIPTHLIKIPIENMSK